MYETNAPGQVLRKIFLLTVMGFAVVLLSGPVLAILSVLLSFGAVIAGFALVGFLVWLPFRMIAVGPDRALANAREMGAGLARDAGQVVRGGVRAVSWPLRAVRATLFGLLTVAWFGVRATFTTARFAAGLAFLAAMGAALGAILGASVGITQGHDVGAAVAVNTIAGAAIAAAAGIVLSFPRRASIRQAPPILG